MFEAGSTAAMWVRMMGLQPLLDAAASSDFQGHVAQLTTAILDTHTRAIRCEAKLDLIINALAARGIVADGVRRHDVAALSPPVGTGLTGPTTVAGLAADDGTREPLAPAGRTGSGQ
jgi:hypothetical protein